MLNELIMEADTTSLLSDIQIYLNWVITRSRRWAISTLFRGMPGLNDGCGMDTYLGDYMGKPIGDCIRDLFASNETLRLTTGISCLKSALPIPDGWFEGNAIDFFEKLSRTRRTCFIGHFREGANWRELGYPVDIIELFPQPGDIHWDDSHEVLSRTEIVLITGLTLINDTFDEVIRRTPQASIRVLLGPTVPFSPVFFAHGIHFVGSTLVEDIDKLAAYCRQGGGTIAKAPQGTLRRVNLTHLPEFNGIARKVGQVSVIQDDVKP